MILGTVAVVNIILSMYIPLFCLYQGMGHSGFPTIVATCALGVRVFVTYLLRNMQTKKSLKNAVNTVFSRLFIVCG